MGLNHEKQFVQLFNQHSDAIFKFCFYRLEDREKAKELTQETFMRTWKLIINHTAIQYPKAILYRIARNLIIDYIRRKKELSLEKLQETAGDAIFRDDKNPSLDEIVDARLALAKLSSENQEACESIELKYLHGLKVKEIADILEVSPNVISVRIHRGLKYLKDLDA